MPAVEYLDSLGTIKITSGGLLMIFRDFYVLNPFFEGLSEQLSIDKLFYFYIYYL